MIPGPGILSIQCKGGSGMNMPFTMRNIFPVVMLASMSMAVQAGGGMSEEQMQQMMEQAQKMQECMARIDQSGMDTLTAKAEAMEKEVKALCDAGKRDQAQKVAIQYGKEFNAAPEMQELQKCSEMAQGMIQQMPMTDLQEDLENRHVCDDM
jgi:hypothetical protein